MTGDPAEGRPGQTSPDAPPAPAWWSRPEGDPWAPPRTGPGGTGADRGSTTGPSTGAGPAWPPAATPRPGRGGLLAAAVVASLLAGLLAGVVGGLVGAGLVGRGRPVGQAVLGPPPAGTTARPPDSVAGIAQRLLPSVAEIRVRAGGGGGTGSGFVIRPDGFLLTNNHVVEAAAGGGEIVVTLPDGKRLPARIAGRSATYDLAVLRVDATGLPAVQLGNSDTAQVGDPVVAIGSPLGLAGTVTSGIISAKDRPVTARGSQGATDSFVSALQTDAAVNPGNSGGPLVDGGGRVIGVNSAIATLGPGLGQQSGSIGLGFAIPINQARRIAEQLIKDGVATYPVLGVVPDPAFQGDGARIATQVPSNLRPVTPGGPADRAGLRAGDVILKVGDRPVATAAELIVAVRAHNPGDTVAITYARNGGPPQTVSVTLGAQQEQLTR